MEVPVYTGSPLVPEMLLFAPWTVTDVEQSME